MHLLLSVSMLPSLQEITPLPLSRVYSPLIVPPLSLSVYNGSQLGRGGPASAPLLFPLLGVFTPQCVPLSLNAYSSQTADFFCG